MTAAAGRMTATERSRQHRERRRRGLATLMVEVSLDRLRDFLLADGRIGEWDDEDRAKLGQALSEWIEEMLADDIM